MRDSNPNWQQILANGIGTAAELLDFLHIPLKLGSTLAEKQFKTRVPRGFAARMEPGNPNDPLLLQVLAIHEELHTTAGYTQDPLAEQSSNPVPGVIHKYHGRVLLTVTGACAVNCRYCFRRHFPYQQNNPGRQGWHEAIAYIAEHPEIHEVILSGGDPLLAKDLLLTELFLQLATIPHLRTLRIHTRIPVVLPERLTPAFLKLLAKTRLKKVIVLHCNHAQELNHEVENACFLLRNAGCHLLNQSVLLAHINDNVNTLVALSERLFECGVLPYYLHLLDKVQGAAHFAIKTQQALTLYQELQARLPGYLVPRLACEEPGKKNKTLIK